MQDRPETFLADSMHCLLYHEIQGSSQSCNLLILHTKGSSSGHVPNNQ